MWCPLPFWLFISRKLNNPYDLSPNVSVSDLRLGVGGFDIVEVLVVAKKSRFEYEQGRRDAKVGGAAPAEIWEEGFNLPLRLERSHRLLDPEETLPQGWETSTLVTLVTLVTSATLDYSF